MTESIRKQKEVPMMRLKCKPLILGLLAGVALTGCGSVYAGTTVNIEAELTQGVLEQKNTVKDFDGTDMVTQDVSLSAIYIRDAAKSIIKNYDYSKIPIPEMPGYWAVINITPSNEGSLPVTVTDVNGDAIVSNGITAETTSFYLGDGWYAAPVPEQCREFSFTAADKIFTYTEPVEPDPVEEITENIEETTEGTIS